MEVAKNNVMERMIELIESRLEQKQDPADDDPDRSHPGLGIPIIWT
jgi:hypothetical protein